MVVLYLVLIEGAKHVLYARADTRAALPPVRHRASGIASTAGPAASAVPDR
ncbi:hypothetical protein EDD90_2936 [Streptomyces sp. Ag109_O5-1]|uniref:hypothetical protein n=1 Tax=Streptomyces sp. Ag109_O5-1 TaxID=1938851 RepID=UPI000F91BFE3|nr:hypothetical protein [Streptomyces sp. Ag109_O5-1]RPE39912.1 hypothetical protein EDD90_2936 [Streptomyces sp. Ag109_O5-1]